MTTTGTPRRKPLSLDDLRARRAEIDKIAARRGAHDVRVFGSIARGEQRSGSDVDLLVAFEPDRSLLDLGGLIADLEDLLGCPVDVVTVEELRPHVRDRVLTDAVRL
jgi:predicted nucleotidyltransferase